MFKKIIQILFSSRLTIVLFVAFGVAMAVGTFLDASETVSPSQYTNKLIYKAWWFEVIMFLFVVNLSGTIPKYNLLRKEKWATLLLHLSFVVIFLGAFITRYIGYEGIMHIKEGMTQDKFLSSEIYFKGQIEGDSASTKQLLKPKKIVLSERSDNNFKTTVTYEKQIIIIEAKKFISNAKEEVVSNKTGEKYLKIVEARNGKRIDHWLKDGSYISLKSLNITLNHSKINAINISTDISGAYILSSPIIGDYLTMTNQYKGVVLKDSLQPLHLKSLYQFGNTSFVIPDKVIQGTYQIVKTSHGVINNQDGLTLLVTANGESKLINLLGGKGINSNYKKIKVGGLNVSTVGLLLFLDCFLVDEII